MVLWIGTPMGQLLAGGWWVEILLYGLLANIAFTGGWAIEWILIRFAHLNPWPGIVREILYFSGTVFSILLTYWIARWFVFKLLQLQWSFF